MEIDRPGRQWLGAGLALCSAALVVTAGCGGGTPAKSPGAESLKRVPATHEAPVRVLSVRYHFRFDEHGNWSEVFSQEYRVENRNGVESWGGTGASWSPWYMARPVIEAKVKDPELGWRELDPKTIAESAEYPNLPSVYSDSRVLRAPLPGIRVGSVVRETIRNRTTRPFFAGGSAFQIAFQNNVPRDSVELVVDLPESLPFNHEILDVQVTRSETRENGRRRVVFRGGPYPGVEGIDFYAPPQLPAWPSVAFSTARSWQEVAAAYAKVVDEKLVSSRLGEVARRTVADADSPREKADKLLALLRDRVRYASVAFGQAAIIPAKPEQTFERAYGDCKDQSLALAGLLRAVGVPATLALLRTGPGQDVRPGLPSLDVFNHAIVVVPGETPLFIDPTVTFARAGELPESDQGRLALIVDADTVELTETPVSGAKENTYLEEREVLLSDYGPAKVREISTATGLLEQRLRGFFSDSKEAMTKSLTDYVKETYRAEKLASWKTGAPEELSGPFRIELEVGGANVGFTDLTSSVAGINYGVLESWLPKALYEEEPRAYDLLLPVAYRAEVRYRVVPPAHFVVHRVPSVRNLSWGPMALARDYQKRPDGSVEARFVLTVDKHRLTSADLEAFRKAHERFRAESSEFVEFEHEGQQAIEARQTVRGMQIFRRLSEADPKSATALLRWAVNLSDMGFGRLAREKARKAVTLAPNDPVAHRTLAIILERDEFGRHLHRGFDRDGARAAYGRAVELDPTDVLSKVSAALLLEFDHEAARYSRGADLGRAVAEFDAIPAKELEEYEDGTFRHNALYCLFYAERFEELRRRLGELAPAETPGLLAVGTAAATAGVMAAVAEADRLGLRGEARSEVFAGAAGSLYMLARYRDVSALFALAAEESAKAAEYTRRAELLRNVVRVEPAKLPEKTPEDVAKKALVLAVAGTSRGSLASLLSARASKETLSSPAIPPQRLDNYLTLPREVLIDTSAGILKSSSDGSDAAGYRVRLVTPATDGRPENTASIYVVRESGRYLVRAADGASELGCEALFLWDQKKGKAAQQWLEWAAEGLRSEDHDPLGASPFVRLWAKGKGSLELAAAALCVQVADHRRALEVLEGARSTNKTERVAVDHALLQAALRGSDDAKTASLLTRLEKEHPKSRALLELKLRRLWRARRYGEYEKVVKETLATRARPSPERAEALGWLAEAQQQLGKIKESRKTYQTIIDERHASSSAHNGAAWNGLFLDPRPDDLLSHALKAAEMSFFKSYSQLHTLATVYLETGKVEEARQTLAKLLELSDTAAPHESTWYVIGGIAEAYGLADTAREAYQKIRPPAEPSYISTHRLAQRRLAVLDGKARAPKAPR